MAFVPNPNFIAQLRKETTAKIAEAAESAADEANELRHRIMPQRKGDAVVVEVEDDEVFLVNTDIGGHLDEFGSANNEAYAPLRNGVRNAGFHLKET